MRNQSFMSPGIIAMLTIVMVIVSSFVSSKILANPKDQVASNLTNPQAQIESQIESKALILLETMNSVREYTSNQVAPELVDRLDTEFLPEILPSYATREIFENLRRNYEYRSFFYKEAALNPTNLRDKTDPFETAITENFQQQDSPKEARGIRLTPSGDLFYIARPITILKSSCLDCHGAPSDAPKSLIERYGDRNGFGWKLNEIVGTQIIYAPIAETP